MWKDPEQCVHVEKDLVPSGGLSFAPMLGAWLGFPLAAVFQKLADKPQRSQTVSQVLWMADLTLT